MRAEAIELTENTAVLLMTPGWLGRLFGARVTRLELHKRVNGDWHAKVTGRDIDYMWHSSTIKHALDFRPVNAPPQATAKERTKP